MTILDAVFLGVALLAFSLVLVVSLQYLGLAPETKPPKRTYLFEDETGERQNPLGERNQQVPPPTARLRTRADTVVLSSASDDGGSTGGTHPHARPDPPPSADETICPNCGFHNLSAYSFCSECTARLTR